MKRSARRSCPPLWRSYVKELQVNICQNSQHWRARNAKGMSLHLKQDQLNVVKKWKCWEESQTHLISFISWWWEPRQLWSLIFSTFSTPSCFLYLWRSRFRIFHIPNASSLILILIPISFTSSGYITSATISLCYFVTLQLHNCVANANGT